MSFCVFRTHFYEEKGFEGKKRKRKPNEKSQMPFLYSFVKTKESFTCEGRYNTQDVQRANSASLIPTYKFRSRAALHSQIRRHTEEQLTATVCSLV